MADYARVEYLRGHRLPRNNLAGVGANVSVALTKRITVVVGYGYGINAPRGDGFGGHDMDTQVEFSISPTASGLRQREAGPPNAFRELDAVVASL